MALLTVQYNSKVMELCTTIQVYLPDEGDLAKIPVVYLLHGLSDNCTGWSRYTSCERYARERGVALIMPEVQRSFYTDMAFGPDYFTYITEELPQAVHRMFGLSRQREYNYVFGLSMGGYGALKCALNHPEQYAGCGSFSGVADIALRFRQLTDKKRLAEVVGIFGPDRTIEGGNDLMALVQTVQTLPGIYLSCGEQDSLYDHSVRFAELLRRRDAAFRFDHRPGAHSWDFWDRSIRDCFDYFFGGKPE